MRIEIRRARSSDIDRILEIEAVSFGRDAWHRSLFEDALNHCPATFFIAKLRGRFAGYCITCIDGPKAQLDSIAIFPEARRNGVAQALLRHTNDKLKRRRVTVWRLMVHTRNRAAIKFYKEFGFKRIRTVRSYYGPRRDAWRMELQLCRMDTPKDPPNPRSG